MYCRKCGKELPDDVQFCQFCGEKQDKITAEKKAGSVSNKAVYLIGAVAGLVIVAIFVMIRLGGQSGKADGDREAAVLEEVSAESVGLEETVLTEEMQQSEETEENTEGNTEEAVTDTAAQEEEAVTDTDTTAQERKVKASYVKSVSLSDPDEYSECWFDKDGDVISQAWYGKNNGQISFQYMTDTDGNKVSGDGKRQATLLDDNNILGYVDMAFSYGISDHLIQSVDYSSKDEADAFDSTSIFQPAELNVHAELIYDGQNRLVEINGTEKYRPIGGAATTTSYRTIYTYQENGGQTTVTRTLLHDDPETDTNPEFTVIVYDSEGRLTKYERNYWDGEEEAYYGYVQEYEYASDGTLSRYINSNFNEADEAYASRMEYEYVYDVQGNRVKETADGGNEKVWQYDENGKRTGLQSDSQTGLWEYDGEGRLTTVSLYGNNGLATDGVTETITEYSYDEQNRIQTCHQSNTVGSGTEEFTMEYRYDDRGCLTEVLVNNSTAVTVIYNDDGTLGSLRYSCGSSGEGTTDRYLEKALIYDLLPENMKYIDSPEFPSTYEPPVSVTPYTAMISEWSETTVEYGGEDE